jgi:hypothetical protein
MARKLVPLQALQVVEKVLVQDRQEKWQATQLLAEGE